MKRLDRAGLVRRLNDSCQGGDRQVDLRWQKEAVHRDGTRVGFAERGGVEEILHRLCEVHGWEPQQQDGPLLGLDRDGARIRLGLGGQIELEAAGSLTLSGLERQLRRHLGELQDVTRGWDVLFLAAGFSPMARLSEIEPVPDPRQRQVERWLSERGRLSGPLLRGGASVEVGLDFRSEHECARMVHVAVALTPIVTALLAASPLASGRPTGFRCFRARCWQAADPQRTGPLWRLVQQGFSFERWLDWLLALPVVCLSHDGRLQEPRGLTFADWMDRGYEGTWPGAEDFDHHLATALPEVRLGAGLVLRGADNGPLANALGLAALWRGLLHDEEALAAAESVAGAIALEDLTELLDTAIESGLSGRFGGRSLRAWAGYLLEIASAGLSRQAPDGPAEVAYLAPLVELARAGRCEADRILAGWDDALDPRAFLAELAYPSVTSIRPVAPSAGRWGTAELRAIAVD